MISVSALTGYIYCPRKVYMQYVLKLREPPRKQTIEGTIFHQALDNMQRGINSVTQTVTESTTQEELSMRYKKAYYLGLFSSVNSNETGLKEAGLNKLDTFRSLWDQLAKEAEEKAKFVTDLSKSHKVYGKELLESIRASIEVRLVSEELDLIGIADRIEEKDGKLIVYETKTGKPPQEGVWKNHKIQVAAYMMMLKERSESISGVVEYPSDARSVAMNPFLEDEVLELIGKVKSMLKSPNAPAKTSSENKCKACGLKESCDALQ